MYTVVNCTHIVRPTLEDKLARGNCWIYNKWNDATGRSTGQYHPVPSQMLLRSRTEKSTLTGALQYMMKQNTANWQPHALNLNTWMGENLHSECGMMAKDRKYSKVIILQRWMRQNISYKRKKIDVLQFLHILKNKTVSYKPCPFPSASFVQKSFVEIMFY